MVILFDDTAIVRTPNAQVILRQKMAAPSTLGTFGCSFEATDICDVEQVATLLLKRAWMSGAGPSDGPLTIDVEMTIA